MNSIDVDCKTFLKCIFVAILIYFFLIKLKRDDEIKPFIRDY